MNYKMFSAILSPEGGAELQLSYMEDGVEKPVIYKTRMSVRQFNLRYIMSLIDRTYRWYGLDSPEMEKLLNLILNGLIEEYGEGITAIRLNRIHYDRESTHDFHHAVLGKEMLREVSRGE